VGIGLIEEDRGIEGTATWAGADPIGIRSSEAEGAALCVVFKPAVDDIVLALVTAGVGDLQVALTGVDGRGRICSDVVL